MCIRDSYNIALGCVTGAIWLGVSIGILFIIGAVSYTHLDVYKRQVGGDVLTVIKNQKSNTYEVRTYYKAVSYTHLWLSGAL